LEPKYQCIIVDDEPLAQGVLETHIRHFKQFTLAGKFFNATEAFGFLANNKVQLMFIDIKMPGLNGIDFVKTLRNPPELVFTTAYQEYAFEGFELDAVDYLLKPVTFDRFKICIEKFERKLTPTFSPKQQVLHIKSNGSLVKLPVADILYAEAMKDYVKFNLAQGSLLAHMTMKTLVSILPKDAFVRVHRSFIVNRNCIDQQNRYRILVGKKEIPIGDLFRKGLEQS
jgi:DNA-binding LytR/AlgR family response regulator